MSRWPRFQTLQNRATRRPPSSTRSTKLLVEEMERRITPATFYVSPPVSVGADSADLRSDIGTANTNGDSSNTINMMGGDYTLTAGDIEISKNLTLQRDPSDRSGRAITIDDDSSGSPGIFTIDSGVTVTVVENQEFGTVYNGAITGTGGLVKDGIDELTLNGDNTFSGGLQIADGLLEAAADADLGTTTGVVAIGADGTLEFTGTTETAKTYEIANVVTVDTGQTVTFDKGPVYGTSDTAYLEGSGTFTTDATDGALFADLNLADFATMVSNSPLDEFYNSNNYGALDFAAGVNTAGTSATENFDNFINYDTGSITIGANTQVNARNFQTYGSLTILDGTGYSSGEYTLLKNVGASELGFDGGSDTQIGTPDDASNYDAGIDLNGYNAAVSDHGGVFNNNGFVWDSSGGFTGTAHIVDDFGFVKGVGFYEYSPTTMDYGVFENGDCPGAVAMGALTFGPGGIGNDLFQINDATGTAGPAPDGSGQVSGWSLINVSGNFTWAADSGHQLTMGLQTLANPTTEGHDVLGPMDNFDPTQSYSWAAIHWTGTYTGPTGVAALNASTNFDTSGVANSFSGTFAWNLDLGANTLYLTYTPAA